MIIYSKLGKKGHLGNQLFQIASTVGLAVQNNHDFSFLQWKYQDYFKNKLPVLRVDFSDFKIIEEEKYNYYQRKLGNENYDISGWLQTEKYFDKKRTRYYFQFSDVLIEKIQNLYKEVFKKKTLLISIRRGDFVDHPDYFQLPINYYFNSLIRFFQDWESYNLVVLSDDIEYCKFHFSFLENVFFGDGLNEVEQLCLGSMCDDFIISNSTFSWWSAWLGEKKNSKIIRPLKNFDGLKSIESNDKDYFPERWICYNHLNDKTNLENTLIAISKENTILENYLHHNFTFKNENKITKLNVNSIFDAESKEQLLVIFDCILPPFLIYTVTQNPGNCVGYLKGKFLNTSKYLDSQLFQKQFDYGLFSKILDKKNDDSNKILFLLFQRNIKQDLFLLKGKFLNKFNFYQKDFSVFNSYAGKIKGFPECKYFFKIQKIKLWVFIKSSIKTFVRPKKIT